MHGAIEIKTWCLLLTDLFFWGSCGKPCVRVNTSHGAMEMCRCKVADILSCPNRKRCNTLQHAANHCNMSHGTLEMCWCKVADILSCPSCKYYILQRAATHCNTLQHTATWVMGQSKYIDAKSWIYCPVSILNIYIYTYMYSYLHIYVFTVHCNTATQVTLQHAETHASQHLNIHM